MDSTPAYTSKIDPTNFIVVCTVIALVWATVQFLIIAVTKINQLSYNRGDEERASLNAHGPSSSKQMELLREVHQAITSGAEAFLRAEYTYCVIFEAVFAVVIFFLISWGQKSFFLGALTTVAFILGAGTSILSGYIGMKVAVYANVRTTINCLLNQGFKEGFNTAFRAGSVLGFAVTGLGILVLYLMMIAFYQYFEQDQWTVMMDCISGYGLGGSSVALFGRVGGGIYTKAADVGADLVGKVVHGIPEVCINTQIYIYTDTHELDSIFHHKKVNLN
jgi:Na+/H+-translocating membrane pyrophosphatase